MNDIFTQIVFSSMNIVSFELSSLVDKNPQTFNFVENESIDTLNMQLFATTKTILKIVVLIIELLRCEHYRDVTLQRSSNLMQECFVDSHIAMSYPVRSFVKPFCILTSNKSQGGRNGSELIYYNY
uniref:Uncharacterized protein n=1 Tax=Onchocerca volvulus TaxID=6282 RepID=A0A8R1TW53_ONCVO